MAHTLDTTGRAGSRRSMLDKYLTVLHARKDPDLQPLLRALNDVEVEAVAGLSAVYRVTHRTLAAWMTENGMPISDGAIYEFRRKGRLAGWLARTGVVIEDA